MYVCFEPLLTIYQVGEAAIIFPINLSHCTRPVCGFTVCQSPPTVCGVWMQVSFEVDELKHICHIMQKIAPSGIHVKLTGLNS